MARSSAKAQPKSPRTVSKDMMGQELRFMILKRIRKQKKKKKGGPEKIETDFLK